MRSSSEISFTYPQSQRELFVEFAGFGPEQCGGHRCDGDGHVAGGQTPESDGSLLGDFVVRQKDSGTGARRAPGSIAGALCRGLRQVEIEE